MENITEQYFNFALEVLKILESKGHAAYLVGGCVRDMILGIKPKDIDIATSARPIQVINSFEKAIPTGLAYGTVTVMYKEYTYEITTFRGESKYIKNRKPSKVLFSKSLKKDLLRRDFTINAMAMDSNLNIIDLYGGKQDIAAKTIRCVGSTNERFKEDALRMLRAIRFSTRLGFEIDQNTYDAIVMHRRLVRNLSAERYTSELVKIIKQGGLIQLVEAGLCEHWLPEIHQMITYNQNNKYHSLDLLQHTAATINYSIKQRYSTCVILASAFHDIGKPSCVSLGDDNQNHYLGHSKVGAEMFVTIGRRLKFPTDIISKTANLIERHDFNFSGEEPQLRRLVNKYDIEFVLDLLDLKEADISSHNFSEGILPVLNKCREIIASPEFLKSPKKLGELAISGKDLINLGFKPSKHMGEVLNKLMELVISSPELNTFEYLAQEAIKYRE